MGTENEKMFENATLSISQGGEEIYNGKVECLEMKVSENVSECAEFKISKHNEGKELHKGININGTFPMKVEPLSLKYFIKTKKTIDNNKMILRKIKKYSYILKNTKSYRIRKKVIRKIESLFNDFIDVVDIGISF